MSGRECRAILLHVIGLVDQSARWSAREQEQVLRSRGSRVRHSAAQTAQVYWTLEELRYRFQEGIGPLLRPAAEFDIAAELVFDLLPGQRFVRAAAYVRLALFDRATILERHAYVSGIRLRVRIVRIDYVAHFGSERED